MWMLAATSMPVVVIQERSKDATCAFLGQRMHPILGNPWEPMDRVANRSDGQANLLGGRSHAHSRHGGRIRSVKHRSPSAFTSCR